LETSAYFEELLLSAIFNQKYCVSCFDL